MIRNIDKQKIIDACRKSNSVSETARILGIPPSSFKRYALKVGCYEPFKKRRRINKQEFIEACNKFDSMNKAAEFLGVPFNTFKRYCIKIGCYKTNQGLEGTSKEKKTFEDVISNKIGIKRQHLKYKLLQNKIKEWKCEKCEITEWFGKFITLELHHIDGNSKNNNLDNLMFLCPNCHSQTPNYKSKNRGKTKRPRGEIGSTQKT